MIPAHSAGWSEHWSTLRRSLVASVPPRAIGHPMRAAL